MITETINKSQSNLYLINTVKINNINDFLSVKSLISSLETLTQLEINEPKIVRICKRFISKLREDNFNEVTEVMMDWDSIDNLISNISSVIKHSGNINNFNIEKVSKYPPEDKSYYIKQISQLKKNLISNVNKKKIYELDY